MAHHFVCIDDWNSDKKTTVHYRFTPQNGVNTLTPLNEGKSQKTGFINHLRQISAA